MARAVGADQLAAARQAMLMLRRSASFRDTVAAHESGERPIVIVSADDRLDEVVERIRGVGLPVTLVVPGEGENPTVMTVHEREPQQEIWESMPADVTIGVVVSRFREKVPAVMGVPGPSAKLGLVLQLVDLPPAS
jgi:predicted transcriptional regulator